MEKYIGKMLDNRYEILEAIGMGGMAVVYKALCHRLNRFVAIKILKDEFARDADFRRRFHTESQAVAMLSHPNIVAVYDVSRTTDVEYIVMELIEGITLKQYIQRRGILGWREALHFTTQIVKALSHAHSRGIIHRDIKPHNIMLLRDGSIKVADFGIARLAALQNTLTQDTLGSVHYISPEQARGSHIDARSDLYSVGVVLYEMLTGRLPFEGESAVSVAIQHINAQPQPPRALNAEVPEALEAITMKAMSASLSHRYASAADMLRDLEEFRKNPSIVFPHEPAVDEPTRPIVPAPQDQGDVRSGALPAQDPDGQGLTSEEREEIEEYRRRRKNSTITVVTGVLGVLVFVFGLIFLVFQVVGTGNNKVDDIKVPYLLNKRLEDILSEANAELNEKFVIVQEEPQYSDTYDEGYVMMQDPEPETQVKLGSTIKVTVSLGIKPMSLPNFHNKNYVVVKTELVRMGLIADEIQWEDSELVADQVIRTIPEAGAAVRKGETVILVVSRGVQVERVRMPRLVGRHTSEVERLLAQYDLALGDQISVDSDKPRGEVVWQSVAEGEEVEKGSRVDIQVSLGSDPVTPSAAPPSSAPSSSPSAPPSDAPSAPPSDAPSPSPVPGERNTKGYNIYFSQTEGTGTVRIEVNGSFYSQETVDFSMGNFIVNVTAYPTDIVTIYVDDVLWASQYHGN